LALGDEEKMIKYDKPYNSIATWICLLTDVNWYLNVKQEDIQWRMSLQFDKEDQNLDVKRISIQDDVIPGILKPVSPVILSQQWYPDISFEVDKSNKFTKFDGGYMNKLTHVIFPGDLLPKSEDPFDKRIVKIIHKIYEKHGNESVIMLHHSVGWSYRKNMEMWIPGRILMKIAGYVNVKRLI
jgi:hypothetical protein